MLREFRVARSLTQAALAERAALSEKSIAALERGRRRGPRLTTVHQLGRALELSPEALAAFAAAAAQPPSSDAGAPDKRPRSEPAEQGPAVGSHDGRGRLPLPAAALRLRRPVSWAETRSADTCGSPSGAAP
jgi:transcriptional regulator with XRE-family HTH domain